MLGTLSVSAAPFIHRSDPSLVCASGAVYILGTQSIQSELSPWGCLSTWTNTGLNITENFSQSSSAIMELRRISGFTWEQLARLFSVTRRSLHFWASGEPINAPNEEHLQRLLATIKIIDRGNASENRSLLLSVLPEGTTPFELLIARDYDNVIRHLGIGNGRIHPRVAIQSSHIRANHTPRPPNELVGARQDSIHIQKGHLISATPIRIHRSK